MRKNIRLMTAVSPELNKRLDALCDAYGMTKSGLIAYYVGKSVDMETRAQSLLNEDTMTSMMKAMVIKGDIPNFELPDGTLFQREDDKE